MEHAKLIVERLLARVEAEEADLRDEDRENAYELAYCQGKRHAYETMLLAFSIVMKED